MNLEIEVPTEKSWILSEKVTLTTDFEKSEMSRSGFSKVHFVPRLLSPILSIKKAIFNSYQNGCK